MAKMSQLQEFYIKENINKLSIAELVKVTGLSARVIGNFAKKILTEAAKGATEEITIPPPSQHDSSVVPAKKAKSEALKRMTQTKGVTVMTEEMSEKGEKPNRPKVTETFRKSIHKMYDE
jgi:hypothetical protein